MKSHRSAAGLALLLLCGCPPKGPEGPDVSGPNNPPQPTDPQSPPPAASGPTATGVIQARSGSAVQGKAVFEQREGKVLIRIEIQGAAAGEHGVHIHEKGDCSAPDGKSAGGHFNPAGAAHGGPQAASHHPGDFGNITVGPDGSGKLQLESTVLTVAPGDMSVVGRAIIIHEKPDDLVTQPTGNAGGRIGCGEIKGN